MGFTSCNVDFILVFVCLLTCVLLGFLVSFFKLCTSVQYIF